MALVISCATALVLGSLHALETDHMAAVASFAVRKPGLRAAIRFAVRWSVGHGGAILVFGALLILFGVQLPAGSGEWLERGVGVMMVALGLWAMRGAEALHAHEHTHAHGVVHAHVHSHAAQPGHDHGHAAAAVGLLHGLAGSGAAVALIPVVGFDTPSRAMLYLTLFAAGTVGGMALYGLLAGLVAGRTARSSVRMARLLARLTGGFTMVIGLVWIVR